MAAHVNKCYGCNTTTANKPDTIYEGPLCDKCTSIRKTITCKEIKIDDSKIFYQNLEINITIEKIEKVHDG